ncbi:hypothetical protein MXB_1545, partial [Myxobolus squamalis]
TPTKVIADLKKVLPNSLKYEFPKIVSLFRKLKKIDSLEILQTSSQSIEERINEFKIRQEFNNRLHPKFWIYFKNTRGKNFLPALSNVKI